MANRSGLQSAVEFASKHQAGFAAVFDYGIDGSLTLYWSQLNDVRYIGNGFVVLELKKLIRFFNITQVELLFARNEDAQAFCNLVKEKLP